MTSKVWVSGLLDNMSLFENDQGVRVKYYGHEWEAARIDGGKLPVDIHEARMKNIRGFAQARACFPEAAAVWDPKLYAKVKDVFIVGPSYAVKGPVAEVLGRFDWGDGGLIPITIFAADLATPLPRPFFLMNFGAIKRSFLPEQSRNIAKFSFVKATGLQIWKVKILYEDCDVAVSSAALGGPDLWFEDAVSNKIFMSDALASALIRIGMGDLFMLKQCRVVEDVRLDKDQNA